MTSHGIDIVNQILDTSYIFLRDIQDVDLIGVPFTCVTRNHFREQIAKLDFLLKGH
jgi:hypothetical protein